MLTFIIACFDDSLVLIDRYGHSLQFSSSYCDYDLRLRALKQLSSQKRNNMQEELRNQAVAMIPDRTASQQTI